jgi:predicted transcriptional regulator
MNDARNNQPYDADTIRRHFEESGNTHIQVAASAEVSIPTVYRVLNGEDVRVSNLASVLRALGLRLEIKEAT